MAQFFLTYQPGNSSGTDEENAAHMAKWQAWLTDMGEAMVNPGTPLGKWRTVNADGVVDAASPPMIGYSIIEAADMAAAEEIAQGCPYLVMGDIAVAEMMQMKM